MLKKSILIENKSNITTKNQQLVIKSEIRESTVKTKSQAIEKVLNIFFIVKFYKNLFFH
jgi:hypothetical protein